MGLLLSSMYSRQARPFLENGQWGNGRPPCHFKDSVHKWHLYCLKWIHPLNTSFYSFYVWSSWDLSYVTCLPESWRSTCRPVACRWCSWHRNRKCPHGRNVGMSAWCLPRSSRIWKRIGVIRAFLGLTFTTLNCSAPAPDSLLLTFDLAHLTSWVHESFDF